MSNEKEIEKLWIDTFKIALSNQDSQPTAIANYAVDKFIEKMSTVYDKGHNDQGPETEPLEIGEEFWVAVYDEYKGKWFTIKTQWTNGYIESVWLEGGYVFKTKESAEKWIKAKTEG